VQSGIFRQDRLDRLDFLWEVNPPEVWRAKACPPSVWRARPPPRVNPSPPNIHINYSLRGVGPYGPEADSQVPPSEVYPPLEGLSLLRSGLVRLRRITQLRLMPHDFSKPAIGSKGVVCPD